MSNVRDAQSKRYYSLLPGHLTKRVAPSAEGSPVSTVSPPIFSRSSQSHDLPARSDSSESPEVRRVSPTSGSLLGGELAHIHGKNFTLSDQVLFGSMNAKIVRLEYEERLLTVLVPPGLAAEEVPVRVVRSGEGEPPMEAVLSPNTPDTFQYIDDVKNEAKNVVLQVVGSRMNPPLTDVHSIVEHIIENAPASSTANVVIKDLEATFLAIVRRCESSNPLEEGQETLRLACRFRGTSGRTLLHLAAVLDYNRLLDKLLPYAENARITDESGYTPLAYALLYGKVKSEASLRARTG